jgi:hypothetical protein
VYKLFRKLFLKVCLKGFLQNFFIPFVLKLLYHDFVQHLCEIIPSISIIFFFIGICGRKRGRAERRKSGQLSSACMCARVWAHGDWPHGRFLAGARKFDVPTYYPPCLLNSWTTCIAVNSLDFPELFYLVIGHCCRLQSKYSPCYTNSVILIFENKISQRIQY